MVSIAGLGFAQGLSSFAENKRQAEIERQKEADRKEAQKVALDTQRVQQRYYSALAEKTANEAESSFSELVGDSFASTPTSEKTPDTTTAPAPSSGAGLDYDPLTGAPVSYATQPYDVSTGATEPSYSMGAPSPTPDAGMPVAPTVGMGDKTPTTTKGQQQAASALAGGYAAMQYMPTIDKPGLISKDGSYGNVPERVVDEINSLHSTAMNLVEQNKNASVARQYLSQFIGKPKPQQGDPEYPEFYKNLQIAKRARLIPTQLQTVAGQFQNSVIDAVRTAVIQNNFEAASNFASKIGFTNKFQRNAKEPNMVDVLAPDGKTVLHTVPYQLVDGIFRNRKELETFESDVIKANTSYAREVAKLQLQQAFDKNKAVAASFEKRWSIGNYYAVDTKGLLSGIPGLLVPLQDADFKSFNPQDASYDKNNPLYKAALANGWIDKSGTLIAGKAVPYSNKNFQTIINFGNNQPEPENKNNK